MEVEVLDAFLFLFEVKNDEEAEVIDTEADEGGKKGFLKTGSSFSTSSLSSTWSSSSGSRSSGSSSLNEDK